MLKREYNDDLKIKDALQLYFSKYHFENGGYDLKWFRIKVGALFIPLPNTKARVDAVKFHDIHHLLTEYPATLRGESEIAGWEIASGCGKYYAAWILNFSSFFYGMFFFPKPLFKGFMRGRKCRTNLYYNVLYDDQLLNESVGDLRYRIGLNDFRKNEVSDFLWFLFYCIGMLVTMILFFYLCYRIVV